LRSTESCPASLHALVGRPRGGLMSRPGRVRIGAGLCARSDGGHARPVTRPPALSAPPPQPRPRPWALISASAACDPASRPASTAGRPWRSHTRELETRQPVRAGRGTRPILPGQRHQPGDLPADPAAVANPAPVTRRRPSSPPSRGTRRYLCRSSPRATAYRLRKRALRQRAGVSLRSSLTPRARHAKPAIRRDPA
jgi:hypothetical protein